jgi:hypothetical protein
LRRCFFWSSVTGMTAWNPALARLAADEYALSAIALPGRTSLTNLKDFCWWHHHVVLRELGWTLTAHPDGTSQITNPKGKTIRSHSPPAAA